MAGWWQPSSPYCWSRSQAGADRSRDDDKDGSRFSALILSRTAADGVHSAGRVVVVARADDTAAMLNHALIQSRRRYRTWARLVRGPTPPRHSDRH